MEDFRWIKWVTRWKLWRHLKRSIPATLVNLLRLNMNLENDIRHFRHTVILKRKLCTEVRFPYDDKLLFTGFSGKLYNLANNLIVTNTKALYLHWPQPLSLNTGYWLITKLLQSFEISHHSQLWPLNDQRQILHLKYICYHYSKTARYSYLTYIHCYCTCKIPFFHGNTIAQTNDDNRASFLR